MKKLQCYVASSFDELNKKCGYGVIMKEECRPIDIISGFTEESWQIKSCQVGGYLIGVLKGIQYAIDNNNLFIPRTNLQRAYKISRKATQEEFDEFHILHKR